MEKEQRMNVENVFTLEDNFILYVLIFMYNTLVKCL
jgi:hypothetical protein